MTAADLKAEDKAFEAYLQENGWDGEIVAQKDEA